jgi:uncharacterized protein YwgA
LASHYDIDIHDLIILVIFAAYRNDIPLGRTMLQKLCYFVVNKLNIDNDYLPHYYGPYSPTVTNTLIDLIQLDLVEENNSITENNRNMYTYYLTEAGENHIGELTHEYEFVYDLVEKIIQNLKDAPGDKIDTISYAAKIHYINKKEYNITSYKEMTEKETPSKMYGWNIQKNEMIENGKKLLLTLDA